MKKHVTIVLLACMPVLAWCQFQKGDWLVGGTLNVFQFERMEESIPNGYFQGATDFSTSLGVVKFVQKGFFVGSNLTWAERINWNKPSVNTPVWQRNAFRDMGINIVVGKSVPLGHNFNLLSSVSLGYTRRRAMTTNFVATPAESVIHTQEHVIPIRFNPLAITYTLKQHWIFQIDLLQAHYTRNFSVSGDLASNSKGYATGISVNPFQNGFSIYYLITPKKKMI